MSDTIKRGTLSKNRKNCLDLINIEAKRQPRGLGRLSDSPETHVARPRTRYQFSTSLEAPSPEAPPERPRTRYQLSASPEAPLERPRTRYRFSVSLEAGSSSAPPPRPGCHIQPACPTTPATSAARRRSTAKWPTGREIGLGRGYRPLCSALCP